MKQEALIDDIIAQLDRSFSHGAGHVNSRVEDQSVRLEKIDKNEEKYIKEVETQGNLACAVPTLMEGRDGEDPERSCE